VLKALVLVAATFSEHWICAAPVDSSHPADIFIWDFRVEGNEIVQEAPGPVAGVVTRHPILWNDDRHIVFQWLAWPLASLAVIEKLAVSDPSFKLYSAGAKMDADGNVEGQLTPEGTCELFGRQ
jgi:hypothetical protein